MSKSSYIKHTWVSLEIGKNGYDRVLNIATDIPLGVRDEGYDERKFMALIEEVKPLLAGYDRAAVAQARA